MQVARFTRRNRDARMEDSEKGKFGKEKGISMPRYPV